MSAEVMTAFCGHRAEIVVNDKLNWAQTDYLQVRTSAPRPYNKLTGLSLQVTESRGVSGKIQKFFEYLSGLSLIICNDMDGTMVAPIISGILTDVVNGLTYGLPPHGALRELISL